MLIVSLVEMSARVTNIAGMNVPGVMPAMLAQAVSKYSK